MSFYDDMQAVASEVFAEFKQGKIEYVKIIPGAGSPDDPGPATQVKTELDAVARGASFKYVAKGLALASDQQVSSAVHPTVVPDIADMIAIDGVMHKIIGIHPKPSAGTPAAWVFICRRG